MRSRDLDQMITQETRNQTCTLDDTAEKIQLNCRIRRSLDRDLERYAERNGHPKSWVIEQALREYLGKQSA